MASRKQTETIDLPALGEEGDTCEECGGGLAVDQRYCLNCGDRRAGPRLEFEKMLPATAGGGGGQAPMMAFAAPRNEWSPLVAVGCLAVLGGMLLLGVLIGKDDNPTTVSAAPAAATPTTAAVPTTPETTAAVPAATPAATGKAGAGPNAAVAGGSGDASGIPTADTTAKTGKEASDAAKNGPDQVATSGAPAAQDPNGEAGDGSGATVIGN